MLDLKSQRILFVGGKGGVGKTTTASALAVSLASRGAPCLLVSTDPAHSLTDLFGATIGDHEQSLMPNLCGLEIDPEAQVERHLETVRSNLREFVRPQMYREIDRQMELARLAPGAVEAAMLERIAGLMIEAPARYEHVIFDTAPTGQTLRMLSLPTVMTAWTDGLLRSRQHADETGGVLTRLQRRSASEDLFHTDHADRSLGDARSARIRETLMARRRTLAEARRLLLDAGTTAFILVLVPEKLPVLESQKALESLRRFDVPVAGVVVNRILPREPLGTFLEQRREQETRYRDQIRAFVGSLPVVEVPLLPHDVDGVEALHTVAGFLQPHILGSTSDDHVP